MKKILKVTLLLNLFITVSLATTINDTTKSIVKVFTIASTPNYKYPWQTSKIGKFTGSGAIISDNRS